MHVKKDLKDLDEQSCILMTVCVLNIEDCVMKPKNCGTRKKYFLILLLVVLLG